MHSNGAAARRSTLLRGPLPSASGAAALASPPPFSPPCPLPPAPSPLLHCRPGGCAQTAGPWCRHRYAYYDTTSFLAQFPASLALNDRVLKQNRGSTGQGIWLVRPADPLVSGQLLRPAGEANLE
jgi:hypothetical protein